MPTYDYKCNACEHIWEEFSLINDRDKPTENPCPECSEKQVVREISGYGICVDTNITPNKVTGGQWNELMQKMDRTLSPKAKHALDRASSRTGQRWSG
tara:strand:+ start:1121 stop:1414 length:294 start_codon:yes stop_codon:yes gene_type:complete